MDEKTARKYRSLGQLPDEVKADHDWRTREDPFEDVWTEAEEKLKINLGLEAKTLFEDLQRRYPGRFGDGQHRTLQRRVKIWHALQGPPREVFFPQVHKPGGGVRYERGSLRITSNLPFSKWERIFKDPMTTAVAIDHLVYHSIILELNLPSYRLEHSTAHQEKIREER